MLYRKDKVSVDGKWHFNPQCVSWPCENFFDMAVPEVDEHELLCSECVRLRSLAQVAGDVARATGDILHPSLGYVASFLDSRDLGVGVKPIKY